jgi:hypothetical protein
MRRNTKSIIAVTIAAIAAFRLSAQPSKTEAATAAGQTAGMVVEDNGR